MLREKEGTEREKFQPNKKTTFGPPQKEERRDHDGRVHEFNRNGRKEGSGGATGGVIPSENLKITLIKPVRPRGRRRGLQAFDIERGGGETGDSDEVQTRVQCGSTAGSLKG